MIRICIIPRLSSWSLSFFFNATAPTEIYTLSLHDALSISLRGPRGGMVLCKAAFAKELDKLTFPGTQGGDRKSTRLNSSHRCISYAVFCLKKKKKQQ